MKGIRSVVLPDLSPILASKGFQCLLPSSHIHVSALSRRFWKFLEFTHKDEGCHDAEKSSKDIVSPSMLKTNEVDDTSKHVSPNDAFTPAIPPASKCNGYTFDLRSTPMTCAKVYRPVQQDGLISLLDGNPVPRTLKWKLKGYKTLRNEQAGDFAFVPGEKTRDRDILSKNGPTEPIASNTSKPVSDCATVKTESGSNIVQGDSLCKTYKVTENKQAVSATKSGNAENVIAKLDEPANKIAPSSLNEQNKVPVTNSVSIKQDAKFLPVSRSELSMSQLSYQTQPAAQYSSRPSKGFWKPSAPVLKEVAGKRSADNVRQRVPSKVSYEENQAPKRQPVQTPPAAEASNSRYDEVAEDVQENWPRNDRSDVPAAKQQNPESPQNLQQLSPKLYSEEYRDPPLSEPAGGSYQERQSDMKPAPSREHTRQQDDHRHSETYFAPRAGARAARPAPGQDSAETEKKLTYESIIGLPPRQHPAINIRNPGETQGANTSPCAATHARLQQVPAGGRQENYQGGALGGNRSPMSTGSSGGASRKPPGSIPPFATRHSSSNTFCLTKNAGATKEADNGSRAGATSKTPSSNISTSSVNEGRRKCDDGDEADDRCARRRSCKPRRQCQQERPKCRQERPRCKRERKEKQDCKRYCCPELQTPRECDFSQMQCPGAHCGVQPLSPKIKDPTCRSDSKCDGEGGRQICTSPTRKKRPRSCKREERQCSRERRDRSCGQEQRGCQRRRSCSRQDSERDQGRTICTNPKRRDTSCKRERRCDDRDSKRSAKCTGRRNYTQLAYVRRANCSTNIKRYSSAPAFVLSTASIGIAGETKEKLLGLVPGSRFYGKDSKSSSKKSKVDNKCKRPPAKCQKEKKCKSSCSSEEDPCKAVQGNCGAKKEGPCKKVSKTGCTAKKEDPCKKASKTKCATKKEDTCGRSKSKVSCAQRREEICKAQKLSKSSAKESGKGRLEREQKEMEECKKGSKGKERKKSKNTNLERVVSPCKQQNDKGSKCKFTGVDVPYSFASSVSATSIKQDGVKLFTMLPDRSYSTSALYNHREFYDSEQSSQPDHDIFNMDLYPLPVTTENRYGILPDYDNSVANWFASYLNWDKF